MLEARASRVWDELAAKQIQQQLLETGVQYDILPQDLKRCRWRYTAQLLLR
uniref:Uncharacterized protein n=1 Tax=Arundo donax TaxID=35708 RepID=A0A0A9CE78_ARUDO